MTLITLAPLRCRFGRVAAPTEFPLANTCHGHLAAGLLKIELFWMTCVTRKGGSMIFVAENRRAYVFCVIGKFFLKSGGRVAFIAF